jgi:hypothetical protein
MQGKYFNNKKIVNHTVQNRRDADKLINSAYKAFMLLGLMALRDEFKFGPERMQRYVDKMHDLLDSYNKGYISIEDLNQTIYEELGIKVM